MSSDTLSRIQNQYLPTIENLLSNFFSKMSSQGIGWNAQMSSYHFTTGGKRLRALLPLCLYEIHGRKAIDAAPLGCALELIHNATLVHDDLQDRDQVRRGKATVWKRYSEPQAINCGDALFQFAFEMLFSLDVSPIALKKIMQRMVRGTLEVIEGQAQEFLMKDEPYPGLDRYLSVVKGKTAALFSTSIVCALEALEVPAEACKRAEDAAIQCGILFQIQDDLLDIYGDKQREKRATDIAEGKVSALVAAFNDRAQESDRLRVSQILQTPREETTESQIQEVIDLFGKYGIPSELLSKIKNIQDEILHHAALRADGPIHSFFVEMNYRFLREISHLL